MTGNETDYMRLILHVERLHSLLQWPDQIDEHGEHQLTYGINHLRFIPTWSTAQPAAMT